MKILGHAAQRATENTLISHAINPFFEPGSGHKPRWPRPRRPFARVRVRAPSTIGVAMLSVASTRPRAKSSAIIAALGAICGLVAALFWASGLANAASVPVPAVPPPPSVAAKSFVLMDGDTNKIIAQRNSDEPLHPASLTKIMTGYVAAGELESGRIALTDQVPISVDAWRTPGSRMFIQEGTQVSVADLLRGIIVQSGNDASVALAEHIAGSEQAFADMMNRQADALGMTATQFMNSTGLPADDHYTSAADLALLTKEYIHRFPENYAIYSERSFKYNDIEQPNRNRLLWRDRTVDGVKTGHTNAAGYCLVASAKRDGMRLISVVMGTADGNTRVRETQKLLTYGFRFFETKRLYEANIPLKTAEIWYGAADSVDIGVAEPVVVTIPRGHYANVDVELELPQLLEAPLVAGEEVGALRLMLRDELVYSAPLVALRAVEESGVFAQAGDFLQLFFSRLFE